MAMMTMEPLLRPDPVSSVKLLLFPQAPSFPVGKITSASLEANDKKRRNLTICHSIGVALTECHCIEMTL